MAAKRFKIGFFGAGKMSTALARGFIHAGVALAEEIIASDPSEAARTAFAKETGARTTAYNPDVTKAADVLVLGVKPDLVGPVLTELRPHWTERHLLISIAAGVTLATLETFAGADMRIIRVMPNTPALVGASASAYALGKSATAEDSRVAERLLAAVGLAFPMKEALLDAVTGLSGSGPAFVYLFIEALSDGGVAVGLPRETALKLAAQTVLGAGRMVLETGLHPGALKDMVTSPGGTTIEGVHELEKGAFRGTVINAVRSAAERARKLGQS